MRGLLVLAMLAACGGPMAEDAESDDLFGPIAVQPLDVPGAAAVGLTAVRTAKDWQALAGKGAASPVDFRKEMPSVLHLVQDERRLVGVQEVLVIEECFEPDPVIELKPPEKI